MVEWSRLVKNKWPKWKLPETKPDETVDTDKVFYEAKLVAGEGIKIYQMVSVMLLMNREFVPCESF